MVRESIKMNPDWASAKSAGWILSSLTYSDAPAVMALKVGPDALKVLIEASKTNEEVFLMNFRDWKGQSLAHACAARNLIKQAQYLMDFSNIGALLLALDAEGYTATELSIKFGNLEVFEKFSAVNSEPPYRRLELAVAGYVRHRSEARRSILNHLLRQRHERIPNKNLVLTMLSGIHNRDDLSLLRGIMEKSDELIGARHLISAALGSMSNEVVDILLHSDDLCETEAMAAFFPLWAQQPKAGAQLLNKLLQMKGSNHVRNFFAEMDTKNLVLTDNPDMILYLIQESVLESLTALLNESINRQLWVVAIELLKQGADASEIPHYHSSPNPVPTFQEFEKTLQRTIKVMIKIDHNFRERVIYPSERCLIRILVEENKAWNQLEFLLSLADNHSELGKYVKEYSSEGDFPKSFHQLQPRTAYSLQVNTIPNHKKRGR